MINPVVKKIDDTHDQVNHMKNDVHQIATLRKELQSQRDLLDHKLDSKFEQMLNILQTSLSSSTPSSTSTKSSFNPVTPSPQKHSSLCRASAVSPTKLSSNKVNLLDSDTDQEDIDFDYTF